MGEELERVIRMKSVYETQVKNLMMDWKEGKSRFCKIKDYRKQLNIWNTRIKQYENEIEKLNTLH